MIGKILIVIGIAGMIASLLKGERLIGKILIVIGIAGMIASLLMD